MLLVVPERNKVPFSILDHETEKSLSLVWKGSECFPNGGWLSHLWRQIKVKRERKK